MSVQVRPRRLTMHEDHDRAGTLIDVVDPQSVTIGRSDLQIVRCKRILNERCEGIVGRAKNVHRDTLGGRLARNDGRNVLTVCGSDRGEFRTHPLQIGAMLVYRRDTSLQSTEQVCLA